MPDWTTYRLSDLLLFAPRTYDRLFELYNVDLWPAHLAALGAGLGVLLMAARRRAWAVPAILALLAGCWLWIAVAFHWQRYATINWAATGFAGAFAAEGLLLLASAGLGMRLRWRVAGVRMVIGFGLLGFAVAVQPGLGVVLGRSLVQAEVFGLAPDPTAVATLGVLLLVHAERPTGAPRLAAPMLWPLPLLWCLISGATLWAMESPLAVLMPAAALLAVAAAAFGARIERKHVG